MTDWYTYITNADKIKTFLTPGTYEKRVMGDDRTAAEAHWADCPQ